MPFTPVTSLSSPARTLRSILLVALLLGSLFPTLGGASVTMVASFATAPVIVYELLRHLPRVHPILIFVLPVFTVLWLHMLAVPPATEYGVDKMQSWMTLTLMTALAASLLRDVEAVTSFFRIWIVGGCFLAVATILDFEGGRADTFGANPIWLARAMATAAVLAIFLVMRKKIRTWVFLVSFVLLVVGVIATGSRGPILGLAIGAVSLAAFSQRHRIRRMFLISLAGGATYLALTKLPFFEQSRLINLLTQGDSDVYRSQFWTLTPPVIAANPTGVGVGNWKLHAGAPWQFDYPHNLFLEVFAEYGVVYGIGLIALILIILIILLRRSRHDATAIALLALIASEVTQVSVSGDLNARTFWFMLTLGYLVAVRAVISVTADSSGNGPAALIHSSATPNMVIREQLFTRPLPTGRDGANQ